MIRYVRKYRSHYLYWTNAPIRRLVVRYEDLKIDTFNELKRVVHFLLDDPSLASMLFVSNEQVSPGSIDPERIACAIADEHNPYRYNSSNRESLFGIDLLGDERVRYIIRELGDIICQMGYHELFPQWLNDKLAQKTEKFPASHYTYGLQCKSFTTVVDFPPYNVSDTIKAIE